MKRYISLLLVIAVLLTSLTACGKKLDVSKSTIYVQKKGRVLEAIVESFDKDYYSAEELQAYVDERVEAYVSEHEKDCIKVEEFSVEAGSANLRIKYKSCEDYANFNEVELFSGTVPQALAAGFSFDASFCAVTDGALGEPVDRSVILEQADYKVVVLSDKVDVKVDGTVLFVSDQYTGIAAKDTVSITMPQDAPDGAELSLVYIIYK